VSKHGLGEDYEAKGGDAVGHKNGQGIIYENGRSRPTNRVERNKQVKLSKPNWILDVIGGLQKGKKEVVEEKRGTTLGGGGISEKAETNTESASVLRRYLWNRGRHRHKGW